MPLPVVKEDENYDDWMERCLSDDLMNEEYPDSKQRFAICQNIWDEKEEDMKNEGIEIRSFRAKFNQDDGEKPKIVGTAAVFDELSDDLGGFREIIHKGAFGELISSNDVFALINHDPNLILGRNKSGTLTLKEDKDGLKFEIDPPDTSYANDLLVSMQRGDIDKCSFAFVVDKDEWENENGMDIRHVYKFSELWDVSVVTYPAFPQTKAELFGKNIKTPYKVYAEYRSKLTPIIPERKQERVADGILRIYERISKRSK